MSLRQTRLLLPVLGMVLTAAVISVRPARGEAPTLTIDAGGHTAAVTNLSLLPDGNLLSGSFDTTIREWDLKAGRTLRVLRGQVGAGRRGQVTSLALTPDFGTLLVGGWFDSQELGQHPIRVYDWPKGTLRGLLPGHDRPVRCLAISLDGRLLASGDYGGVIRCWQRTADGLSFRELQSIQAHSQRVSNLLFDPTGGDLLVSTGYDGLARYWRCSPQGMSPLAAIRPLSANLVYAAAFRPDGQVLAFGGAHNQLITNGANGEVRFFDRAGQQLGQPISFNETGVNSLAFAPDGRRLAVGCGYPSSDTRAFVYSHPEGRQLIAFDGHDNTINAIRFLADGRTIVSAGGYDSAIRRWDSETGQPLPSLGGQSRFVWNVGVSADGKTIYWGANVFDPKARFGFEKYNQRGPLEWGLTLEKQPELIPAGAAYRGTIQQNGQTLQLIQEDKWQAVQLGSDGPIMASNRPHDVVFGATFLPFTEASKLGAKLPVLVAGGESLGLFDASSGRRIRELFGHVGQVLAVAPSPLGDFAVTSGGDQTVRLWHLPTGELRLSIFHAGDDWVAWTPKGYYAASPQGDRLIGWQLNRGEGKDPEHYTANQFSKLLYRPDLIQQVLLPGGVTEQGPGVEQIDQIVPPEVNILEPAPIGTGPVQLGAAGVEIKAIAKSQGSFPVTELRLLLNGRPFDGKQGVQKIDTPRPGAVTASWKIDLAPGQHALAVQAKTAVSTAVSPIVPVSFTSSSSGKPPVDLPNLYVLAIGVSAYAAKDLALNYAAKDAQAIDKVFRERGGLLRKVEVKLLTDQLATRAEILKGLQWLKREMTQRDVGVVFFSGHGMKDDNGDFYLLPVDVDTDNLLTTAVPGTQLRDMLAGLPGKVIALLDACHAGAAGEEKEKRKSASLLTDDLVRDLINEDCGVVVMCSSLGRESSLESNQHRQGYFTLALTEGLAGSADYDSDSVVDLKELDLYVTKEVKRLTNGRQHPVTKWPTTFFSPPLTVPAKNRAALAKPWQVVLNP